MNKNSFEETLFKTEDERYEYDQYIQNMDSILQIINVLETGFLQCSSQEEKKALFDQKVNPRQ